MIPNDTLLRVFLATAVVILVLVAGFSLVVFDLGSFIGTSVQQIARNGQDGAQEQDAEALVPERPDLGFVAYPTVTVAQEGGTIYDQGVTVAVGDDLVNCHQVGFAQPGHIAQCLYEGGSITYNLTSIVR